jgi:hypothetical protein
LQMKGRDLDLLLEYCQDTIEATLATLKELNYAHTDCQSMQQLIALASN